MSGPLDALCRLLAASAPVSRVGPLCGGLGALSHRLDRRRRGRALERLGRALPELSRERRREIVRDSFRHRAEILGRTRALSRLSDVDVCRGLTLQGWERLQAIESAGPPPIFWTAPLGFPALVGRALSIYRAPLASVGDVPVAARGDRRGNRRGDPRGDPHGNRDAELDTERSTSLLVALGPEPCGGTPPARHLAELSLAARAPVVPIFALPGGAGYRLEIDEPLAPPAGDGVEALAARCLEVVATRLRSAPELWPWADLGWPPG